MAGIKWSLIAIVSILHLNCSFTLAAPANSGRLDPIEYLKTFGWLRTSDTQSLTIQSPEVVIALRRFQLFAELPISGAFDDVTLRVMSLPRCGGSDMSDEEVESDNIGSNNLSHFTRRAKRYILQGTRWKPRHLMYNISKYSKDMSPEEIDSIFQSAFQMWENVANLTFSRVYDGKIHIDIRFETRYHGDEEIFDGPGGTTAHAYFPVYGGDIHFDDDESWTSNTDKGVNLFQVAVHEIGHALGLEHSDLKDSVMAPFYRTFRQDFKITVDDMEAIQALYGKRVLTICDDSKIDAATTMGDGFTYLFKGQYVFKLTPANLVDEGYPRAISIEFENLPGDLDAAITRSNGASYFFKGDQFWRITNNSVDHGFPKKVSEYFPGIPTPIDAAMVFSVDENIYFFRENKYWRFDPKMSPPVSEAYPKPISDWKGIPNNIDAATRLKDLYGNEFTYFFKENKFWRFNDKSFSVFISDPPYPKAISRSIFGCKV